MIVLFYFFAGLLLLMNSVEFYLMRKDKLRARHREKRIPERTLLLVGALFGALGGCIAMYAYHHKTRHLKFSLGLPMLFLLQVYLILLMIGQKIIVLP